MLQIKTQRLKACVSNVANSLMIKDSRVNSERTSHDVIHFFLILSKYSVIPLLSLDWLGKWIAARCGSMIPPYYHLISSYVQRRPQWILAAVI